MSWLKHQQHSPQTYLSHSVAEDRLLPVQVTAHYAMLSDRPYCHLHFQPLKPVLPQSSPPSDSAVAKPTVKATPDQTDAASPLPALELERLQTMLNVMPVPAILFCLSNQQVLGANGHLAKLFGFVATDGSTPANAAPSRWYESFMEFCFDAGDRQPLLAQLEQEPTLSNHQLQVKKADHTPFKVSISLQKLTVAGEPAALCTFYDLSEHQRTEEALRQSEARFRTLADTTNTIIFIRQGKQFSYVNPAAHVITGYTCEELLSCPDIYQLIKERGRVRLSSQFPFPKLFPQYEEVKILTKTGEECWLDCSIAITEFDGKPAILGTAIDITKRKQAETEIRNALAKEKELSELKSQFISMVSHEFRSPLNVISFSASSLQRFYSQWPTDKKLKYLSRIQTSTERIGQLLDEILLIGRVEAGKLEFQPKPMDLVQFFGECVTDMQLSDSNNHPIRFVVHGEQTSACVDERLLQPTVANLLSNALKYSPVGSPVQLELWIHEQQLVFEIVDQGIGVPVTDQSHLYELFHRGKNVHETPGCGIGLAIVKKFVEAQQGHIEFTSKPNEGTTFRVTLPLQ
jgi:PAS domain S-box-containing protein